MKDREVACKFYVCENNCAKGHDGTFYRSCQHCALYEPIHCGRPARKNLKRIKLYKNDTDLRAWLY